MPRRLYIYREGTTARCAATRDKDAANLPESSNWRFWMQVGAVQARNGQLGFDVRTAIEEIQREGFHLFTGSAGLLGVGQKARQ